MSNVRTRRITAGRTDIDWRRLVEPQDDGYDAAVALEHIKRWKRQWRPTTRRRGPSMFDGRIALAHVYASHPQFPKISNGIPDAPLDHPNALLASEYLRAWPAVWSQVIKLIHTIHPALAVEQTWPAEDAYPGSCSHSFEDRPGTLWATVNNALGFAQSIVHELAHQKLRALGVSVEGRPGFITNDPSELFVSPIVTTRLRPMTALVHAQYSFVYVTALDLAVMEATRLPAAIRRSAALAARHNANRISLGIREIMDNIRTDDRGTTFVKGLSAWTDRLVAAARATPKDLLPPTTASSPG
jgi:HEXXH motif-containing protein